MEGEVRSSKQRIRELELAADEWNQIKVNCEKLNQSMTNFCKKKIKVKKYNACIVYLVLQAF
jgi:hypothetical protein